METIIIEVIFWGVILLVIMGSIDRFFLNKRLTLLHEHVERLQNQLLEIMENDTKAFILALEKNAEKYNTGE